jgi:VCBS repeat protein
MQHALRARVDAPVASSVRPRKRALLASSLFSLVAAGWFAGVGCAEPAPEFEIPPGSLPTDPDAAPPPGTCEKTAKCGDGCSCGDLGCCPEGTVCVGNGARCWATGQSCTTTNDCEDADNYCTNGVCLPYLSGTAKQEDQSCRQHVDLPTLVPEAKCRWPYDFPPTDFPDSVQVAGTPMVIDFDFDGNKSTSNPSIVFVSYAPPYSDQNGVLRVIDGKTCKTQFTISGQFPILPDASPALGNLDLPSCPRDCPDPRGDARPEIVFPAVDRSGASDKPHIIAYRYDADQRQFVQWWDTLTTTAVEKLFSISIDDLDNDGSPEVITADQVLAPNGKNFPGEVLFLIPFQGGRGLIEPPVITDITGDRFPDVVTSQGIYVWDLTTNELKLGDFWPERAVPIEAAFTAVAELTDEVFDQLPDNQPEMVVVDSEGSIAVMNIQGQIIQRSTLPNGVGGPPTIADFDGDGRMEYASAGKENFTVFDLDCRTGDKFKPDGCKTARTGNANAVLWSQKSLDTSSGYTGSSVFDFDGDGKAEVVYADECFLRMYDGATGTVLQSMPRSSRTEWEYPVVADVDGDGHAEIVVGSNDNNAGFTCPDTDRLKPETRSSMTHGITVWGNDGWAGSRPIWNQYSYYVAHVRDDGTIPPGREVPRFWMPGEGSNSFRENTQGDPTKAFSFNQADLTTVALPNVPCVAASGGGFTARISLQMCNRGLLPIPAEAGEVALMDLGNTARPPMCSVKNGEALASGACAQFFCNVPATATPMDIELVGDPSDRVKECFEDNNRAQVVRVACSSSTIQ